MNHAQKGVPFIERDIAKDPAAMEELVALGVMTTPVTLIDREVVIGFDQARLEELLAET